MNYFFGHNQIEIIDEAQEIFKYESSENVFNNSKEEDLPRLPSLIESLSTDCSSDEDFDEVIEVIVETNYTKNLTKSSKKAPCIPKPHQCLKPSLFNPNRKNLLSSAKSSQLSTSIRSTYYENNYNYEQEKDQKNEHFYKLALMNSAAKHELPEELIFYLVNIQRQLEESQNLSDEELLLSLYDAPEIC